MVRLNWFSFSAACEWPRSLLPIGRSISHRVATRPLTHEVHSLGCVRVGWRRESLVGATSDDHGIKQSEIGKFKRNGLQCSAEAAAPFLRAAIAVLLLSQRRLDRWIGRERISGLGPNDRVGASDTRGEARSRTSGERRFHWIRSPSVCSPHPATRCMLAPLLAALAAPANHATHTAAVLALHCTALQTALP